MRQRGSALVVTLVILAVGSIITILAVRQMSLKVKSVDRGRKVFQLSHVADTALLHMAKLVKEKYDPLFNFTLDPLLGIQLCVFPPATDGNWFKRFCDKASHLDLEYDLRVLDNREPLSVDDDEDPLKDWDGVVWLRAEVKDTARDERSIKRILISADDLEDIRIDPFGVLSLYGTMNMDISFDPYIVRRGANCEDMPALVVDGQAPCVSGGPMEPGNDFWARGALHFSGEVSCHNPPDQTMINTWPRDNEWIEPQWSDEDVVQNTSVPEIPYVDGDESLGVCDVSSYAAQADIKLSAGRIFDQDNVDITAALKRGDGTCETVPGSEPFVWNPIESRWEVCTLPIGSPFFNRLNETTIYADHTAGNLHFAGPQGSLGGDVRFIEDDVFLSTTWVTEGSIQFGDNTMLSSEPRVHSFNPSENNPDKMLFVAGGDFEFSSEGGLAGSYFQGNICIEAFAHIQGGSCGRDSIDPGSYQPHFTRQTHSGGYAIGCAGPNPDDPIIPVFDGRMIVGSNLARSNLVNPKQNLMQGQLVFIADCREFPSTGAEDQALASSLGRLPVLSYYEE